MCGPEKSFWSGCGHSTFTTSCSTTPTCRTEPHITNLNTGICPKCQHHVTLPLSKPTINKLEALVVKDMEMEHEVWKRFEEDLAAEKSRKEVSRVGIPQITLTPASENVPWAAEQTSTATATGSYLTVGHSWKAAYNKEHRALAAAERTIVTLREKQDQHDAIYKVLCGVIETKDARVEQLKDQAKDYRWEIASLRARCAKFEEEEQKRGEVSGRNFEQTDKLRKPGFV